MAKANFGQAAKSYARSRNDIPVSFFESLNLRGISFGGKKIADIGSGTGILTRKLKLRKAEVIGVEPSVEMLDEAVRINLARYENIPYLHGTAEDTGLEANHFDIVTVFRAWHWFNREAALKEIKRILKPKGKLIVADSGFLPGSLAVEAAIEVLEGHLGQPLLPAGSKAESRQRINGFPVEWFSEWQENGLELRDFYKLDYEVVFSNEEWVDRIMSLSNLACAPAEKREEISSVLLKKLHTLFGENVSHTIPHACHVCIFET
ncbi:class I SAM-dependent methyltransferase [Bacillus sp. ISL-47]|uniref:class I SAM-dependent methyltransferase n=1 Tax=Bacillus sp. ISL-47 TaxID=2819130 RepID=UPI001BE5703B|nr:class I SAM-dependent methyltransferase [Bacillus sp. ISL-47]MBT2688873.1 class I SAM-dependent methyltransferase [Bacillus sp. ISL-47]MBT2709103.1 class I SAM-dependent methyltransferase [Pseudomonas sp. ISL-84]